MLYTIQTPKESSYLYLMPLLFSFHTETKNLEKKNVNIKRTMLLKVFLILKRPLCYLNDIVQTYYSKQPKEKRTHKVKPHINEIYAFKS